MAEAPADLTVLDSLGANPFATDDSRHAEWKTFSADVVGGLSHLISSLREILDVRDATSYEDWRCRYTELSPPAVYDPGWVAYLVKGDQTHWIFARFTRVLCRAFDMFIRGPEDLDYAKQIVQSLGDAIFATLGGVNDRGVYTRVAHWREWWRPTKGTLRHHRSNLQRAGRMASKARTAASSDPVSDILNEPGWLPVVRADWHQDAAYSQKPPPLLRPVATARLVAITTLRKTAAQAVQSAKPLTAYELEQCLAPAFEEYTNHLFDKLAEGKLKAAAPSRRSKTFVTWLKSKCLPAVIDDVCKPIFGQFLITLRYIAELLPDVSSPGELAGVRRTLWRVYAEEVIPGAFTDRIEKRLGIPLQGERIPHWEAQAMESRRSEASKSKVRKQFARNGTGKGDAKLLKKADGTFHVSVDFPTAENYAEIGSRRRQQLVKEGVLTESGKGKHRRITVESLIAFCPPND